MSRVILTVDINGMKVLDTSDDRKFIVFCNDSLKKMVEVLKNDFYHNMTVFDFLAMGHGTVPVAPVYNVTIDISYEDHITMKKTQYFHAVDKWVFCQSITHETRDGYKRTLEGYEYPIRIVEENFPSCWTPLNPNANCKNLYMDINDTGSLAINVIGTPDVNDDRIIWGFEGSNGFLAFVKRCNECTTCTSNGGMYVQINHHKSIGYWFGLLSPENVMKYFNVGVTG